MKVCSVIFSRSLARFRYFLIIGFLSIALFLMPAQYGFGQRIPNEIPRVMLGVRFSGDSAHVSYVKPNGPAYRAGLQVGDEIFSVNDDYVLQSNDLLRHLANNRPGDSVRVEVKRNGEYRFFDLDVMTATLDGQRVADDGTILPPLPEYGMVGFKAPLINVSNWHNLPGDRPRCQLADFSGKVVVLLLFQPTCTFSEQDGMPLMAKLYDRHKNDPDVQFLSVMASFPKNEENTLKNAIAMCERFGLPIPIGHDTSKEIDNTVCKQLKALGSPWFVMIDRKGFVALNGMPEDVVDADVIEKIKRGEVVMESSEATESVPQQSTSQDASGDQ